MSGHRPKFFGSSTPQSGIGLKPQHYGEVLDGRADVGWFEVHTENYMGAGGAPHHYLEAVRRDWDISLHGVGLSLGGAEGIDADHVARIARVVDRYEPFLVSEHVSWSTTNGRYLNDLLPLPYTIEALDVLCRNVSRFQEALGRTVLMENPSTYLRYVASDIPEPEFLAEMVRRTGCGLLLDVNNVYVSARNLDFDPYAYLDALPLAAVGEIHLAGHHVRDVDGREVRIDDHGSRVCDAVWDLFRHVAGSLRDAPALIEWDTNVPDLSVLLGEAAAADTLRAGCDGHKGDGHADVA